MGKSSEWRGIERVREGDVIWTGNGWCTVEWAEFGGLGYRDDSGDYHERSNVGECLVQV